MLRSPQQSGIITQYQQPPERYPIG